ncbi:hypothetical protein TRVL_09566 [Trypanosoma vivax]|nr:hypothetical protein TRVL_09566 [Trypanosoma vivax]
MRNVRRSISATVSPSCGGASALQSSWLFLSFGHATKRLLSQVASLLQRGRAPAQPSVGYCDASRTTPALSISLASASSTLNLGPWFDECGSGVRSTLRHTASKRCRALL